MHGNEIETEAITIATKKIPKPEIGDYVDYTPDTPVNGEYVVNGKYNLLGKYSGYTKDQVISQEELKWQVLKVHDDGSIDLIGTATATKVYLKGALGYNNGVYLLNDMCKEIYSKPSAGIEARSVNLKDFEETMTDAGKTARDGYTSEGVQYGKTKTYTENTYYPNLYARENGSGINSMDVKTDGIASSDKGYEKPTEETYSQATSGLTVTQTMYSMPINEQNYGKTSQVLENATYYWVASRYVGCLSNLTYKGIYLCKISFATGYLFNSIGQEPDAGFVFRPVVTLKSGVKLNLTVEGTNSVSNPHKIIQY